VQAALFEISASRTVPQVFIGGEFVGGADGASYVGGLHHCCKPSLAVRGEVLQNLFRRLADTLMEEHSGKLQKRLEKAGITPKA